MSAQIIKTILHVDMDAFFASVEEVLNPNLKGRPMIVCGYSRRGVVSSPNYAARKFGIKAAMPVYHAVARCPNVVMQPPHFSEYEKFSNEFVSIIAKSFTKNIQKTSIDECYVDITSIISLGNDAIKIAKDIQKKIFNELGLTCSIGIAHNKFLAKMATDMNKPNGITTLYEDEIKQKLWPLEIKEMYMVGVSTVNNLRKNGINTIGDLANDSNLELLKRILNKNWLFYYQQANGIGDDQLEYINAPPKSIACGRTFMHDTADYDEIKEMLHHEAKNIVSQLDEQQMLCKTISVGIKKEIHKTISKAITLSYATNDFGVIFENVMQIFQDNFCDIAIRHIGISVSSLITSNNLEQGSIFDLETPKDDYVEIVDKINREFKKRVLFIAESKLK